jgi:autotransporter-associated beta strand protein
MDQTGPVASPRDLPYGRTRSDPTRWAFLAEATPLAANAWEIIPEQIDPVLCSHASGVYPAPFSLELSHPDPAAVIVYTLDGSEPDIANLNGVSYRYRNSYMSGPLLTNTCASAGYAGPIAIADRSSQPNRISRISSTRDASPGYFPSHLIKKATVVRSRAYIGDVASPVTTATYFVSADETAFAYDLPLLSLCVNEDAFFDYTNGIYVAGVDYVTSSGGLIGTGWANYNRGGDSSERPGHFQVFDNGALVVDQGIGFRIHGNMSRHNAFKSLRVYASRQYDTLADMDYRFFDEAATHAVNPDDTLFKRLVLRNPSLNELSFCRLFKPVYEGVGGRLQPAIQFINGEYWGVCMVRDRLDQHHLASQHGLDADNITMVNIEYGSEVGSPDLRVFNLDVGVPEDMDAFWAMRAFIIDNDMADPANYAHACELLDVDNFVHHLILKIFAGDDHYAPEYVFWKTRAVEDSSFGDGRWRVIVKDFDSTLKEGNANYVTALATGTHPRPFGFELFRSLLDNAEFRNIFINRFADLLNAHFRPERFQEIINAAYEEIAPWWNEMVLRWNSSSFSNPSCPFTTAQRDTLIARSINHPPRQRQHICEHFGLTGTFTLTVDVSDQQHGRVRVNTIEIDSATPGVSSNAYPWAGSYFNGIPVRIEALPASGYRLAGWRINGGETVPAKTPVLIQTLAADTLLEAVFAELDTLHLWTFDEEASYLQPDITVGGGALAVAPGALTVVTRNTTAQGFDTAHLRINNPLGAALNLSLPTTGFEQLMLSFEVRRSGSGAGTQTLAYTLDGNAWIALAPYEVLDADPQTRQFDFSQIPGAADNPLFAVRITFTQGAGGVEGNNRFDHIRLKGAALPGENRPPAVSQPPPNRHLIEAGAPLVIDLSQVFSDPDNDALAFAVETERAALADLALVGSQLTVTALQRGECVVTLTADDGEFTVATAFRILIYPAPHTLANGTYAFTAWSPDEPEGSYPPHMLFLQSEQNDSALDTPLERAYHISTNDYAEADAATIGFPYNNTSRTRINGLGADGIAFINTGRDRDLGGALLALDTTGLDSARVAFTAGTVVTNLRVYAIRLQGRVGTETPFADVPDQNGQPVEYLRHVENGHSEQLAPVSLPAALLDQPYVQLLWRYYLVEGESGARAQLRLDDVRVAASDGTPAALAFVEAPASAQSGRPLAPVIVRALDAGGLPATGFNAPVTVTLTQGSGLLSGTLTVNAVNGVALFDDLALTGTGLHRFRAAGTGLEPADGALFRALALTGEIVPAYIQGDQSNGENTNRVPFVWQARIEGLEPHAVYRFAQRIAAAADAPASDGAGNMIWITSATENWIRSTSSPLFQAEDFGVRHFTLTADAEGVFRGWFITEPTGNLRFTPGSTLFPRLLLNDGAGGEAPLHALTSAQAVTVLRFGAAADEGSGLMGQASTTARSIAVLYTDAAGLTRPLAATPVEITGAGADERYVSFYHQIVAVSQSYWGTIIPNILTGGVQRIEYRAATDGALLDVLVDANGFSGTVAGSPASTKNPVNGTAPLIVDTESGLPRFLPGDSALWHVGDNWSTGVAPSGQGRAAIVNAPATGDRTVNVNTAVTIGTLRINQSATPYRNRFRTTSSGTLSFDGGGQAAMLRVEGTGAAGYADFDFDTAIHLATDLVLLVNQSEGDSEYGALRLQQRWLGSGGVVKQGPGMASLTGAGKEFTGPLVIEQGALRVTAPATPTQAASVAVQAGGQLRLASGGTAALPAAYTFGGGAIALAGMGRGGDLPPGEALGVLGALRFDPGANDSHAALANAVELTAASDMHVDGTRNTLILNGAVSGSFPLTKTGGGTLVLAASSARPPAIVIQNGVVSIQTEHLAAIKVEADGVLTGAGVTGPLTGSGLIAPGTESLTSASSAAAHMAFVFRTAGSLTGNGTLVLTAAEPLPAAPATVDLYLDAEGVQPGDRFPGGPCVPASVDLASALSATAVRVLVADPAGEILHQGRAYRVAEPADQLSWSVADWPAGRVLEVLKGGTTQLYAQWRNLNFADASLRADVAVSGPVARPAGDGVANLTRYALAVGPYDPVADLLPRLVPLPAGGFDYRFRLNPDSADLAWVVRISPDLIDWSAVLFDSREESAPLPDAGGWSSLPVPMDADRLFLRLDIYLLTPDEPLP